MTRLLRCALAVMLVLWFGGSAEAQTAPNASCTVTAKVDVISTLPLLPGEPLELNLRISNPANSAIQFFIPNEETGSVRLLYSKESAPDAFKKYRGPLWGLVDDVVLPTTLAARASYDLPLRVLHQVWREPFVLNTPGIYRVKLTYEDGLACKKELVTSMLEVKVVSPTGSDLAVWNALKDCVPCAFFLHTGTVRSTQADQDAIVLLRSLVKQYPSSRYAKVMRKQLDTLDCKDKDKDKGKDKDKKHCD